MIVGYTTISLQIGNPLLIQYFCLGSKYPYHGNSFPTTLERVGERWYTPMSSMSSCRHDVYSYVLCRHTLDLFPGGVLDWYNRGSEV